MDRNTAAATITAAIITAAILIASFTAGGLENGGWREVKGQRTLAESTI